MEAGALRGRIIATLDPDADTRRRAELELKGVSNMAQTIAGDI